MNDRLHISPNTHGAIHRLGGAEGRGLHQAALSGEVETAYSADTQHVPLAPMEGRVKPSKAE